MKFELYSVGRVVFGCGQVARVGEIVGGLGRHALIVWNGSEATATRVADTLKTSGVAATLHRQRGEPTVADVDAGVAAARAAGCDCVVGVGGGSAIDAAKAVAGLLTNGGSAVDYMEVVGKGLKITKPAAPWVAIPTTAGTGAEATRNAVVGLPEKKFKASIRSELLLPRVALIDPELGVDVPPAVTAASGMDALCQLIESYTSTGANALTDPMALRGMELAARWLRPAHATGDDLAAREAMATAAYLSGVTLTNAGLGAVHGFAAPLGANFPVPHGVVCAALLPPVIRANIDAMSATGHAGLYRYAHIGRIISGRPEIAVSDAVDACESFARGLARDLRIPPLSQFGLTDACVPEMVALAKRASSMKFNPVVLSDEALACVLRAGIAGA